jgi:hypothetical protein
MDNPSSRRDISRSRPIILPLCRHRNLWCDGLLSGRANARHRYPYGVGKGDVFALLARQALLLIGIGLLVGLAASLVLTRVLKTALYEVSATDPATFTAAALFLSAGALIACVIPTLISA